MIKKLILLMLFPLLLSGCGGSAAPDELNLSSPEETAPCGQAYGQTASTDVQEIWSTHKTSGGDSQADDGVATDSMHYFIFTRDSTVSNAKDGTELLYEYRCNVDFFAQDKDLAAWVDDVLYEIQQEYDTRSTNLEQYAQENLQMIGKDTFYGYSNYQDIGTTRHDDRIISLLVLNSVYSGGAHPNNVQTAWNLDLKNKRVLKLEDVLVPGGEEHLEKMVLSRLQETFDPLGEGALFPDYRDTVATAFTHGTMTPYWYFNEDGLVIFFNQYEIGPYAAGITKIPIPYERLDGILADDYALDIPTHQQGNLLLNASSKGRDAIYIDSGNSGALFSIGTDCEIRQIRLSEVSWLEGTAIGRRMLFSANRITSRQILVLAGSEIIQTGIDNQKSFSIEFPDCTGKIVARYIHSDDLS